MNEKIKLGDFIYQLRKEKNLSQNDLGKLVGVSNKAVSKWETNEANPDLSNIIKLAEALGITTDELLQGEKNDKKEGNQDENNYETKNGYVKKTKKSFEYKSKKTTAKGTPFVHVNLGVDENGKVRTAKGLLAIGIISKGFLSIGIFSLGFLSIGIITFGLFAFGSLTFGLLIAVGGIAMGVGVSIGGIAIGVIAIGGISIGIISIGGLAIGIYPYSGVNGKTVEIFQKFKK